MISGDKLFVHFILLYIYIYIYIYRHTHFGLKIQFVTCLDAIQPHDGHSGTEFFFFFFFFFEKVLGTVLIGFVVTLGVRL